MTTLLTVDAFKRIQPNDGIAVFEGDAPKRMQHELAGAKCVARVAGGQRRSER